MKKIVYSALIGCLIIAVFSSCKPQDSDSHNFSGTAIDQEDLSWEVTHQPQRVLPSHRGS